MFLHELNRPIETDVPTKGKPNKQTYFQKMAEIIRNDPKTADEIDEFTQFDPTGSSNR